MSKAFDFNLDNICKKFNVLHYHHFHYNMGSCTVKFLLTLPHMQVLILKLLPQMQMTRHTTVPPCHLPDVTLSSLASVVGCINLRTGSGDIMTTGMYKIITSQLALLNEPSRLMRRPAEA